MPNEAAERLVALHQTMAKAVPADEVSLGQLEDTLDGVMTPEERRMRLADLCRELLFILGENPDRPGLRETPRRWADWWLEFMDYSDDRISTTFETAQADQMVVVRGLRVWSLCEHHLLPFWCDLTMGYIPHGRILGLSKFGRIARVAASRLSVQEDLVERCAGEIQRTTGSPDVAVLAEGEHLCMTMRGIRSPHRMQTSVTHGVFRGDAKAREEFFHLAGGR